MSVATDIKARLTALDWRAIEESLWEWGSAKTPPVLAPAECAELIALYADDGRFRSRVDMARYRFGVGDYKYFAAPLPPLVEALLVHAYPPLAAIANRWETALGAATRYPPDLPALLTLCRRRGQTKPTPLLLHYETGGYNCLHQDLYGDVVFPLQLTGFLSRPGVHSAAAASTAGSRSATAGEHRRGANRLVRWMPSDHDRAVDIHAASERPHRARLRLDGVLQKPHALFPTRRGDFLSP